MPKSSKKKKEKAADFSKAKLKLGKGKQTPNNAIDTSFKARSVTLPSQNIGSEKDGLGPTTKRKLTFDDLLVHLKHYNVGMRRDALLGLRELIEDHPEIAVSSLTPLLNGCVRLIADEDASVRKALLSFLSWLLLRIPRDDLLPHAHLLLLFTTSAQTHIFPEIRIDAIRYLDLCLAILPELVVEGWAQGLNGHGRRVLEGYLGVLNAGTAYNETGDSSSVKATSTASVILSPASKLVVLKSLLSFLSAALSRKSPAQTNFPSVAGESSHLTFMSSAFTTAAAFTSFDAMLRPKTAEQNKLEINSWKESAGENVDEDFLLDNEFATARVGNLWAVGDLVNFVMPSAEASKMTAESSTGIRPETAYVIHLLRTLHPIFIATFLDYAPSVFSPSSTPPETELQTVATIAGIAQCLYGAVILNLNMDTDAELVDNLSALVTHMTVYFPFSVFWPVAAKRDIKVEQTLQDLNLVFCELTSCLILSSASRKSIDRRQTKRRSALGSPSKASPVQIDRVCQYIVGTLKGEISELPGRGSSLSRPINAASYVSILPTVWALLNHSEPEHADAVLLAVIEHAAKTSSTSAVKRHTIEFLGRLLLLETATEYCGQFRPSSAPYLRKAFEGWLIQLPKTLWELQSQNLSCTEIILRFLLRFVQRSSTLLSREILASVSARVMPFFVVDHCTHGKLPGPFSKLPQASHVRTLALDFAFSLYTTGGCCEGFKQAVFQGCSSAEQRYWLSITS
ncbi:hypothetical protein BC835DRAFT_1315942 [Cytidiella melzeri]|nr:hypothetical protein BC835DRAFT_1315942 [Cytidiella melzeri]